MPAYGAGSARQDGAVSDALIRSRHDLDTPLRRCHQNRWQSQGRVV